MASFHNLHFNRRSPKPGFELIEILKKEYACSIPYTIICIGGNNELYGFPDIVLRNNNLVRRIKCLADMKDKIKDLIREDDNIVNVRDCIGAVPLHLICSLHSPGQLEILKILCTQTTSHANTLDGLSRTPLHHAVSPANLKYHSECDDSGESLVDIVTLLVTHGANVNAVDCRGLTPLHLALDFYRSGSANRLRTLPELVKTFLEFGANLNLNAPSVNSMSSIPPLHLACRLIGRRSLDVLSLLVSPKNVNSADHQMRTPLHEILSIRERKLIHHEHHSFSPPCSYILDKVRLLLDNGAVVNAQDDEGMTPLLITLENPIHDFCVPLVKMLLDGGACPNVTITQNTVSPLHLACKYLNDEVVDIIPIFLNAGANLNVRDYKLLTPFHCALIPRPRYSLTSLKFLSIPTLSSLVSYGADPTLQDIQGNNSIHMVCVSPNPCLKDVITFLTSKGCQLNHCNKQGNTPLLHFLQNDFDRKSIETLIELGADCRVQNLEGISALHLVSRSLMYHNDVDQIVEVILKGGADVNAQDYYGNTPLHYAVRDESTTNIKAVRRLLLAGANLNIFNSLGITPLHMVCSSGSAHLAKMFLDFGADVNKKDGDSNTPLHIAQAASENASKLSRILVENGANLAAKNSKGATPFVLMTLPTYRFMIGYTVLLIACGKYSLGTKEETLLEHNSMFNKRYLDCHSCVQAIKTHFVGNSTVTLSDFLLSKNERAVRYIRNQAILDELEDLTECPKYRWYSTMIKDKLQEVKFLNTLMECSMKSLKVIWSPFQFPDLVSEKVLSFFDEDDMNALNRAIFHSLRMRPCPDMDRYIFKK